jgi:uncharacterized integral membrane protein (TIGR00698 family)
MSLRTVFFGPRVGVTRAEVMSALQAGVPGLALALGLGLVAPAVAHQIPGLDPLVASIVSGMLVALVLRSRESLYFRILPGILLAQAVLIPVGIALYGKNLDLPALRATSPWVVLAVVGLAVLTFLLIDGLGKVAGLARPMRLLLGFGSAICGASAIAIASPILECEPDDTATGLVDNTLAVLLSLAILHAWVLPNVTPKEFAAASGALLQQTGVVKMALASAGAGLLHFGLLVKSLRVLLLVVAIPAVSWILKKQLYVPWYLVLFLLVAVIFSSGAIPEGASKAVNTFYDFCFASALASIGLNADIGRVVRRLGRPLVVVMVVFGIDLGLWWVTRELVPW